MSSLPTNHLRLEWVYGYRSHQCRNNALYNARDEIVYFVAGVGIVLNAEEKTQRYFLGHDDDIVSLVLHPQKILAATGQVGKEPKICIWNTTNSEVVSLLTANHQHGVGILSFDSTGELLVSIGLDPVATITVWNWQKGKIVSTNRGHTDRVFDCQFSPSDPNLIVSCGVKHIKFWTLSGNSLSSKKGIFGKVGEIQTMFSLAFGPGGTTYAATMAGDIYVWNGNNLERVLAKMHSGPAFCLTSCDAGFASGGKDGCVRLYDSQMQPLSVIRLADTPAGYSGIAVRSVDWRGSAVLAGTQDGEILEIGTEQLDRPAVLVQSHSEGELWALAPHPKKPVFATASDDQTLRIWHAGNRDCQQKARLDRKARSCAFNEDGSLIACGFIDGGFTVFRTRDLVELFSAKERKEVLHEMKFSPDGKFLAVGSNDNFVDIYDVQQKLKKVGECRGNSSFITHLDWSEDSQYIQTNSGAAEHLVFKAPAGKQVVRAAEIETIKWRTWTGVLGDCVKGIWEKYTDTNDVNAVDVNFEHEVLATGDDFGLVKLFRYPSTRKGSNFRRYVGHSAHVTNVRWLQDGCTLVSIGGADHAVFQWRLVSEGGDDVAGVGALTDGVGQSSAYLDSGSEGSDTDSSAAGGLDSDVEAEKQVNYDRFVDKAQLASGLKASLQAELPAGQKRKRAPDHGLKLDFAHGYRAYDCHRNLFYAQSGEILFNVAAIGVVHNKETNTQRFYTGHTDDILCLTVHPNADIVATGQVGKDPTIHVWEVESLKALSILKGQHERGVCAVAFSGDGRKLASVGLDDNHCIVVWDWRKGERLATTRAHKDRLFVIRWNPHDPNKLITVGVRLIRFWTVAGAGLTSSRGTFGSVAKLDTMLSACYGTDAETAYTCGASGLVYVWQGNVLSRTVKAHEGPCFALEFMPGPKPCFVTGGKDGNVCVFDDALERCARTFNLRNSNMGRGNLGVLLEDNPTVRSVMPGRNNTILAGTLNGEVVEIEKDGPLRVLVQGHRQGEVWGLAAHPTEPICVTASDDRSLRVWHLDGRRMLACRVLPQPARCCDISHDGRLIGVGFRDGSFQVLNFDSLDPVVTLRHRKEEISDIKFSPNPGKYLAVASHDNFVDIYNVATQQRVGVCKGCSSYVTHIDWDANGKLLMVNSGAREQLFFEAPRGNRQVLPKADIERLPWHSWTCVLGDTCEGVWPPKCDITDVNATSLSHDRTLLATADDFGLVKLFEYPAKGKFAKYKQYVGHSAHVTNCRWSFDDTRLMSVGGADTALLIWRHCDQTERRVAATAAAAAPLSGTAALPSDDSDTDSEEEGGYDSDVEREKRMDYASKTYQISPLRERVGKRPTEQQQAGGDGLDALRPAVSRKTPKPPKVVRGVASGDKKRPHHQHEEVADLQLEFVHGYRGFDCRSNLHYLNEAGDTIVYHAAGACIVHQVSAGTQSFFLGHDDDILCLMVNRVPKFAGVVASAQIGSADPPILVWSSRTLATLATLRGAHSVGVCSLDFSASGKHLVSVGLDSQHTIAVWRWQEGQLVTTCGGNSQRVFRAEFRPDSDSQFVSVGVKHVKFWTLAGSQLVHRRGQLSGYADGNLRMTTMLSIAFAHNGVTYTGAMSGDVFVWQEHRLIRLVEKAHQGPVFSLYTTLKDGLIVSGGKEKGGKSGGGLVKLWDQEMKRCREYNLNLSDKTAVIKSVCRVRGKILVGTKESEIIEVGEKDGALTQVARGHGEGELWGLAVHPGARQFATASDDGTCRIWDIGKKTMLHKLHSGPARSVAFSQNGEMLAAGLKNGSVLLLNTASLKLIGKRRDRGSVVSDVRFSPDSKLLAVGSAEGAVDFYQVGGPGGLSRLGYCKGLEAAVLQTDFSADSAYLKVTSASYTAQVFTAPAGEPVTDPNFMESITWQTWTSIVGPEVLGIWPKSATKGDINCAHLCHCGAAMATGDDFGNVKLFAFPVTEPEVQHKTYFGHSAHVTNVRFTYDDSYLVSVGGDDCCVFVWKCKP
ncbi:hypothetical protein BOX15_Mlig016715g1 [Macrostomum lignano]|uniref:WD_REPEATS_REGION domain-containing protein n=1 Tax=Macrostomum lignano TaxID=282301 RepID=A0A267GIK4_9PLAT|nr:hypothetical protein BOX15_Mlig016715g1 [Macrostomum lignano]